MPVTPKHLYRNALPPPAEVFGGRRETACGRRLRADDVINSSSDLDAVTCGACRRSHKFGALAMMRRYQELSEDC